MTDPLEGARHKVSRAEQHLKSLEAEIAAYIARDPYRFGVENDGKFVRVWTASVTASPPLMLSCILGDCLTNLRASLDYIAFQLAIRYAGHLSPTQERTIQFPLVHQIGNLHKSKSWKHLHSFGVPAKAMDIIESVQPYHAGNQAIRLLNFLVNIDKHRLPILTVGVAQTSNMQVWNVAGETRSQIGMDHLFPDGCTDALMVMMCSTENISKMEVDGKVTMFVAFGDPSMPHGPVDSTIEQVVKSVADIIPRFDPFV